MKDDASHIESIGVVSNTRWDREFRKSFEKTRRRLVTMLDVTLGALESDSAYHSFTMDGHCIMIDDYLELRGEKRALIEKLAEDGSGSRGIVGLAVLWCWLASSALWIWPCTRVRQLTDSQIRNAGAPRQV